MAQKKMLELAHLKTYLDGVTGRKFVSGVVYKCDTDEADELASRLGPRDLPVFRVVTPAILKKREEEAKLAAATETGIMSVEDLDVSDTKKPRRRKAKPAEASADTETGSEAAADEKIGAARPRHGRGRF